MSGPTSPASLLVTVDEAGQMLSMKRWTIYELHAGGELDFVKLGRSTRLRVADVEAFAAAQPGRFSLSKWPGWPRR